MTNRLLINNESAFANTADRLISSHRSAIHPLLMGLQESETSQLKRLHMYTNCIGPEGAAALAACFSAW